MAAFPKSKDILPSRAGIASRTSTTMQQNVIKTKIIFEEEKLLSGHCFGKRPCLVCGTGAFLL